MFFFFFRHKKNMKILKLKIFLLMVAILSARISNEYIRRIPCSTKTLSSRWPTNNKSKQSMVYDELVDRKIRVLPASIPFAHFVIQWPPTTAPKSPEPTFDSPTVRKAIRQLFASKLDAASLQCRPEVLKKHYFYIKSTHQSVDNSSAEGVTPYLHLNMLSDF